MAHAKKKQKHVYKGKNKFFHNNGWKTNNLIPIKKNLFHIFLYSGEDYLKMFILWYKLQTSHVPPSYHGVEH